MGNFLFDAEKVRLAQMGKLRVLGEPVYGSEIFRQAHGQEHHKHTTVALHSERVAAMCLHLADHLGMTIDEEQVVLAALSHDLGIIGRHEKFKSEMETYLKHPDDSADIAKELLGEKYSDTMEDMIRYHMWPISEQAPETKEGFLIMIADKICAIQEARYSITHIRKQLYAWMVG